MKAEICHREQTLTGQECLLSMQRLALWCSLVRAPAGNRCRTVLTHSQSASETAVRVDIPADDLCVGMAGGMIQTLAGLTEFIRNNMFAGTALASYGAFWIGYEPSSVYIFATA